MGFLHEHWPATSPATPPPDTLRRYLRLRATMPATPGADLHALLVMAAHNTAACPGAPAWFAAYASTRWPSEPCAVDGRLDAVNWRAAGPAHWKADALDGHAAHDMIGGQDILWDIAGAVIELAADGPALCAALGRDPAALPLATGLYAAFRLGRETLAGGDPDRYRRVIEALI